MLGKQILFVQKISIYRAVVIKQTMEALDIKLIDFIEIGIIH